MDWVLVIGLILGGLIVIAIEVIFVPGTTIVGFLGAGMTLAGLYLGYKDFGTQTGHLLLGGTVVFSVIGVVLAVKFRVWEWFALKKNVDGRVVGNKSTSVVVGQEGITVSALRPMGTADFEGEYYEVTTLGNYLASESKIKIVAIEGQRIVVEPLS